MSTLKEFLKELKEESIVTRKMLQRIPVDKQDWRPHAKSMSIQQLAGHLADLANWISMAFTTLEMDFEKSPEKPADWKNNEELLDLFEKGLAGAIQHLESGNEEDLDPMWTLRSGETIFMQITRRELVRHAMSQTIHHRAQLGVFLRLLDVPIPGTYGPSADEQEF